MGAAVTRRLYPGMGHLVNDDEIAFVQQTVDAVLASAPVTTLDAVMPFIYELRAPPASCLHRTHSQSCLPNCTDCPPSVRSSCRHGDASRRFRGCSHSSTPDSRRLSMVQSNTFRSTS